MKSYLRTKDFSVSQEEFELFHDEDLDMLVTKPRPNNLDRYYESEAYISHTDSKKSFVDKIYQLVKSYSLKRKVSLLNSFKPSEKTILDIGAGTGDFLAAAKKSDWKVNGVEPNSAARNKANKKGIVLFSDLNEVSNKKFQIITLWHVLEHLPDLENQIASIVSLLDENGTLVIAVPNFKSYDAEHYEKFWAAYDVPRHLWHFSKQSIQKLFEKHKMEMVKTKPMLFDSFYVSLLSEKYKTGKQNFIKAFFNGLKSNLRANSTKEYSSHVYILRKSI
ncbi:class I SAM-dependent methyltransferase [Croceitalea sp. MTPC9]|uniref:class I SAM-dependent methyltransferase n=1 Tax=unclassified Croceitalea TaxID=2632280 RepID=UPI002B39D4A1|nr:class I SAM-dependent methyltransferase [Croceitalea sp. MTPC6]GMN16617.1 class I SAM-dependent methyltransferase [Croceitalea sp. MTPC9]